MIPWLSRAPCRSMYSALVLLHTFCPYCPGSHCVTICKEIETRTNRGAGNYLKTNSFVTFKRKRATNLLASCIFHRQRTSTAEMIKNFCLDFKIYNAKFLCILHSLGMTETWYGGFKLHHRSIGCYRWFLMR